MKERPILFNSEMVRAILDGRKTQTRRLNGLKDDWIQTSAAIELIDEKRLVSPMSNNFDPMTMYTASISCPYGKPDDRLWVRETWATPGNWDEIKPSELIEYPGFNTDLIAYRATEEFGDAYYKWRPSIFMPRWASRITLEITEIRIERLQDISLHDINAEGTPDTLDKTKRPFGSRRQQFQRFWDSISADRGFPWDKNPWVWVINFSQITKG